MRNSGALLRFLKPGESRAQLMHIRPGDEK